MMEGNFNLNKGQDIIKVDYVDDSDNNTSISFTRMAMQKNKR